MKYDYLIVGTGLFGSVFAREMANNGATVLIIDKRDHIGGNCYTENNNGIQVHKYGPHIFNTSNDKVWSYIKNLVKINHFSYRPKVNYKNSIYSFPINLFTLYQLWDVKTPKEAMQKLDKVRIPIQNPQNLEEWILSQVGEEIYYTFIYGYTKKQWGREPSKLPVFLIKRIPIRLIYDDNYYHTKYQGIPIGGYTSIFEKLLDGLEVKLGINYLEDKNKLDSIADKVVYTGAIDEFFNYDLGNLEWRSLRFEEEIHSGDFQGVAAINYTEECVPYTRIIEHKHFEFGEQDHTVITKEYPQHWQLGKEKYYPINDDKNNALYAQYKTKINRDKYIFGGRLAKYQYYWMSQVIGSALKAASIE